MGFLTNILSSATKIVLSPVAIVADVAVKVVTGDNPEITKNALKSSLEDIEESFEDLGDGDFL